MTDRIEGGCKCGALRYVVTGRTTIKAQCHCRDCQYFYAGGPQSFFMAAADGFELESGEVATYSYKAQSGNTNNRHVCATCFTPVYVTVNERPDDVIVSIGSLDDPSGIAPRVSIWTKSAADWSQPHPDLPIHS